MKKIILLLGMLLLASCTSSDAKNTMRETKDRVDVVEKDLWENQIKAR